AAGGGGGGGMGGSRPAGDAAGARPRRGPRRASRVRAGGRRDREGGGGTDAVRGKRRRLGGRSIGGCLLGALAEVAPARAAGATREPPDAPLTWDQVGRDAKYVFSRPAHLDRKGWAKLAWAVGVGASLYLVREQTRDFIQDHHDDFSGNTLDT